MNPDERRRTELLSQARRAATMAPCRATPTHLVERYRAARFGKLFPADFVFAHLKDIRGKSVLDFGCGDGALSVIMAQLGARVTALDISPDLIHVARTRAAADGVLDSIEFVVKDVTTAPLSPDCFDVVVCNLVLHHVDLPSVLPRIIASLRPGGKAVFLEPIAFSPLLQRVRDLVPIDKRASPGERPLSEEKLASVLDALVDPEIAYFNLFGRLRRLLPSRHQRERGYPLTRASLFLLYGVDRVLLTLVPRLRRYSGTVAVAGTKPVSEWQQAAVDVLQNAAPVRQGMKAPATNATAARPATVASRGSP